MEGIQNKFSKLGLNKSDVLSTWVGVRPLIFEEGKDVTEISRKDEIFVAESGLITIAGGKLTGYRHMAKDIISTFLDQLDGKYTECRTDKIKLTSNPFKNTKAVEAALEQLSELIKNPKVPEWMGPYLIYNYGNAAFDIVNTIIPKNLSLETITIAELSYTIDNESVRSLLDFYERRTGRLYFEIGSILPTLDSVAALAKVKLGWSKDRFQEEMKTVKETVIGQTAYVSELGTA